MPAIDFLRQLHPNGPWLLTAILPRASKNAKTAITTATFGPDSEDDARAFVERWNGKRNLYYNINPTIRPVTKKTELTDMKSVVGFHVDIDARAGVPLVEEIERIRAMCHGKPPQGVPPPTFIIFSGNGYQMIWKLRVPIQLDGDRAAADDAALYSKKLEQIYEADHCHNIDRVLRLPGTVNMPDWKKKAKGRVEVEAKLSDYYPERTYTIADFEKAPAAEPVAEGSKVDPELVAAGRITDLKELDQWNVPDRVKIIIAQGKHPDQPKEGDNSRSAWLFDVCCQLVRAEVPDAKIMSIITDPDWAISASVLELKGRAAEKYARKQIVSAHKEKDVAGDGGFKTSNGKIVASDQHNIRLALSKLGVNLTHDQFANRQLVGGLPDHGPVLQDEGVAALYLTIDERFGFRPGKDFFWMVVEDQARRNSFNPVTDYLDGLEWDGAARVDDWLTKYGGAEDTPYTRAVGALVLLAAVRRARKPGCKFDEMLVLVSPQGTDKSSALAALVPDPDWFTDDLPLGADTKVVIERMAGRWIVEAAELKGMRDRRTEHLKAFLSRQVDRARMAYGHITREVPRQCIIVGTTNDERFLTDLTGNRRFWPVRVEKFDVEALRRDRDQLWAEAARREAKRESIRLDPKLYGAAAKAQRQHEHVNPFHEVLEDLLRDMEGKIRSADLWMVVGVRVQDRRQGHNDLLGAAMRELGWTRTKLRFDRGQPEHCYVKGEKEKGRVFVQYEDDGRWRANYVAPF